VSFVAEAALIALRESLGYEPEQAPYYGAGYHTRTTLGGIEVHVTTGDFGTIGKCEALLSQIVAAMEGLGAA
jgi:hypothetical protein